MAISAGNTKVPYANVSLIPVKDCGNCALCKKECYALKSWRMYSNVRTSWKANSRLARKNPQAYFAGITRHVQTHQTRFFRWHVAGDILGQPYLDGMARVALECPDTKFLCFTKMHNLDYSALPENLTVIFSRWPSDAEPENLNGLRYSWVQDGTETRIPSSAIECPGFCGSCGVCWNLPRIGRDVFFHIH